ncbi:hypothetical protein [Spirosoma foliorum]|uniref:PNPLA domain-containing protein n=1 Tax=Spirosoma foliorum TaxID=2710596 RepID=A0A7G5H2W8_9BACT|nr:hypothetical protein [Spirosoma foliorum]QMW05460.1 hypothetical protein H3H32_11505 [Spirosoma foliorum]
MPAEEKWPAYSIVLRVLRNVLWPILVLVLGGLVLTKPDQAKELIFALTLNDSVFTSAHYWFVIGAVFVWSLTLLTCCRLLLERAPQDVPTNTHIPVLWLCTWLPLFLSIGPYIITTTALADHEAHPFMKSLGYWFVLILALGLQFYLHIWMIGKTKPKKVLTAQQSFKDDYLHQFEPDIRINLWINVFLVMASVVLFFTPLSYTVSPVVGTAAVFLFGLAFFTLVVSPVIYFNNNRSRPLTAGAIILIILFSRVNDNSLIQTVEGDAPNTRPILVDHFDAWIEAHQPKKNQTLPMILVAAEGGGIRAMNWTADMLLTLNKRIPEFDNYLYAISGVSGGGVGGTFYTAYQHDQLVNGDLEKDKLNNEYFQQSLHEDYLAPVVAAMLFLNTLQSVLPFRCSYLDRTKWLENSWGKGYEQDLGLPTLEHNFLDIWKGKSSTTKRILPALFLNGTLAESGQKVITTNINIAPLTKDQGPFTDVLDVLDTINTSVPAKTAALLCARFPVVTGGGWLRRERKNARPIDIGHVTDGGYFDNTGIETTLQILNTLRPRMDTLKKRGIEVVPYIIFIQNSTAEQEMDSDPIIHFLRGIREPLASLYNPWGRSSITRDKLYKSLSGKFSQKTVYINLKLKRSDTNFPLGWYICQETADKIKMLTDSAYLDANKKSSPRSSQPFAFDSLQFFINRQIKAKPYLDLALTKRNKAILGSKY